MKLKFITIKKSSNILSLIFIFSVIDFCLTKELNTDPITNYTSLKMVWASKASCTQRAGRAGRVASGRVYRLVKESFYKVSLSFNLEILNDM